MTPEQQAKEALDRIAIAQRKAKVAFNKATRALQEIMDDYGEDGPVLFQDSYLMPMELELLADWLAEIARGK